MTDFDERVYDTIIHDIDKFIKKKTLSIDDIEYARNNLMKDINKKPYESAQLNDTTNSLKSTIDKIKFDKKYFKKVANKVKVEKKKFKNIFNSLNDLSGLSYYQQIKVIMKVIFKTLVNILDDFIIMFITICVVLNLFFRASLPIELLYPSNPNQFPYVFFDSSSLSKQTYLTSSVEINNSDPQDDVFLDTPAYFSNDGKYAVNKNICKINDPFGTSDKAQSANCHVKINSEDAKYFITKPSYENMSFFAKKFIESNSLKKGDELGLYSLLTYVMLFSTHNSNSYFSGLESGLQLIFPKKKGPLSLAVFFMMTLLIYGMCHSNKFVLSEIMQKIIFTKQSEKFNILNILEIILNTISSFFAPFLNIFKLIFIFVYPIILFSLIYAYINYSTLTTSYLNKFICYLGVGNSFVTLLGYVMMFIYIFSNKAMYNKSLNSIFDDILSKFIELIQNGIKTLEIFITKTGYDNYNNADDDKTKNTTNNNNDKQDNTKKGKNGSGESGNKKCTEPSFFDISIFTYIFSLLVAFFIGPALVILFMIPFIISLTMTFNITKALTLDFWYYINKIICMMGDYKLVIRLLFYMIIIVEITKYTSKKFSLIIILTLLSLLLMDLRKDYIKQMMEKSKCGVSNNNKKTDKSNIVFSS
jgi:hypothetical protein